MRFRRFWSVAAVSIALAAPLVLAAQTRVELRAVAGLRYDQLRFAVEPGADVVLSLRNEDEMMHNIVVASPGTRLEIVNAALALGESGLEKSYVPESEGILASSKVLNPGESDTIRFRAPETEGVYPYICTFPGHGLVMFGAMYVTTEPLPPLVEDPHVPPQYREDSVGNANAASNVYVPLGRARVLREFMPDCGPAAIAVALPGGINYCWDAAQCRLRYAWSGAFVDIGYHKHDGPAKVLGDVFWRADDAYHFPLAKASTDGLAFLGYRLVEGTPVFEYQMKGALVQERIVSEGAHALRVHFTITPDADAPRRSLWTKWTPPQGWEVVEGREQLKKNGGLQVRMDPGAPVSFTMSYPLHP